MPTTPALPRTKSLIPVASAALLALLGFLPIANWIAGGHEAPWFANSLSEWLSGSAIAVGGGIILTLLARRTPALWREGLWTSLATTLSRHPALWSTTLAAIAFTVYALVARTVFDGRPLLIDELSQLYQAQTFASGHLWRPTPAQPELFDILHQVNHQGRAFSQFPPGGPAFLTLGVLLGAPWLVGPACGALAVALFVALVRRIENEPGPAVAASLLFAFAPFAVFMSGSYMNHVPTLLCLVAAMTALAHATSTPASRPGMAFLSGLGFGLAATIRPVDGAAFALPAGAWYLHRSIRDHTRWLELVAAGTGVALPLLLLLAFNQATTGAPLLFGYQILWGHSHDLGFHAAPWGPVHTPLRGLELLNLYALRLQTFLFESPVPSLLPAIVALALTRSLNALDRYLLASAGILLGAYFAYWHDGFYLGPRFVYLLLPLLALWTARLPSRLRAAAQGRDTLVRPTLYTLGVAALISIFFAIPIRAHEYQTRLATMREDIPAIARSAGARNALILVRESWGSQLVARLRALGVSQSHVELLYPHTDACRLELAVSSLENARIRGDSAFGLLQPLLADSSRVVRSTLSSDDSERMLPGASYPPICQRRLADDSAGFTLYAPTTLVHADSNVYARDLHGRDSSLAMSLPGRTVFLLKHSSADSTGPARLYPVNLDSARQAWRADR